MTSAGAGFPANRPDLGEFQGLAFLKAGLGQSRQPKRMGQQLTVKWLAILAGRHRADLRRAPPTEASYRQLADTAADMITRHGASGEVEYASPAAAELTS